VTADTDETAQLDATRSERLREVLRDAGFTRFRVAAETPMNLVIEARP